jgi:superfamily II DNA helicase RecQ
MKRIASAEWGHDFRPSYRRLGWYVERADGHSARMSAVRRIINRSRVRRSSTRVHAGLEAEARSRVQEEFLTGKTREVVAANAFGMSVDKSDVRLVFHYQLPATIESYYVGGGPRRSGR